MIIPRVIPCLLLRNGGLVKTVKFSQPTYLGDPINIVRIFNDKEVDEIALLDITASLEKRGPDLGLLAEIATECFVPLAYGGGLRSLDDVRRIIAMGFEKVVLNTIAFENPEFVRAVADEIGTSSVVVSMDVRHSRLRGYRVCVRSATQPMRGTVAHWSAVMEKMGAGELLVTAVDRDGTRSGYDLDLVRMVTSEVNIPVIACGGARDISDVKQVVEMGGASAAAAGSFFVYQGSAGRAVLISAPPRSVIEETFQASN